MKLFNNSKIFTIK